VTDRDDEGGKDPALRFGSVRLDPWKLSCGGIKFALDPSRNPGSQYYGSIDLLSPTDGFSNCIKWILAGPLRDQKRVLIFVHGYKNTFEDAVRRATTMAYDYSFDGPIVVWTWPSDGRGTSYPYDEDSTKWSAPHFLKFLKALHAADQHIHLSIFTHSMGVSIILPILHEIQRNNISLDTIIFAAPDEARDVFKQTIRASGRVARIQTLYGSDSDYALFASRYAHSPHGSRVPRAGDGGKSILIVNGLESIDTSELPHNDIWGHSYVFENIRTVKDIKELINELHSAHRRGLPERHLLGRTYWALLP
jgi:esterase/lipase superfamily enzyme